MSRLKNLLLCSVATLSLAASSTAFADKQTKLFETDIENLHRLLTLGADDYMQSVAQEGDGPASLQDKLSRVELNLDIFIASASIDELSDFANGLNLVKNFPQLLAIAGSQCRADALQLFIEMGAQDEGQHTRELVFSKEKFKSEEIDSLILQKKALEEQSSGNEIDANEEKFGLKVKLYGFDAPCVSENDCKELLDSVLADSQKEAENCKKSAEVLIQAEIARR